MSNPPSFSMYAFATLLLLLGTALAAPLTTKSTHLFERGTVECSPRYGWALKQKDCYLAAAKMPSANIQFSMRPTPFTVGSSSSDSGEGGLLRGRIPTKQYLAKAGTCVVGASTSSPLGISVTDLASVAGRVYNIIINCVTPHGHGGKDVTGDSGQITVSIWQDDSLDDEIEDNPETQ